MCVYIVVFVGCCCICGGPHLTWLRQLHGIRVTHSNSQTNCPLKRTPGGRRKSAVVRLSVPVVFASKTSARCRSAKRARPQFLWWACFMPPKGKKQQQGNNPSSSRQMSNERFSAAPRPPYRRTYCMPNCLAMFCSAAAALAVT